MTFDMKEAWPDMPHDHAEMVEEFAVDSKWKQYPLMNIVIMIVGSRGVCHMQKFSNTMPLTMLSTQQVMFSHTLHSARN